MALLLRSAPSNQPTTTTTPTDRTLIPRPLTITKRSPTTTPKKPNDQPPRSSLTAIIHPSFLTNPTLAHQPLSLPSPPGTHRHPLAATKATATATATPSNHPPPTTLTTHPPCTLCTTPLSGPRGKYTFPPTAPAITRTIISLYDLNHIHNPNLNLNSNSNHNHTSPPHQQPHKPAQQPQHNSHSTTTNPPSSAPPASQPCTRCTYAGVAGRWCTGRKRAWGAGGGGGIGAACGVWSVGYALLCPSPP
ncbi:hypothetical protein BDR22DRAFT_137083 [Usnea florida]